MDVSNGSVGLGIGAVAAAAAAWTWLWQRRQVAALARRLEESEHSRLDLQAHADRVDHQLASMAEALARQQTAMAAARVIPGTETGLAPVQALLRHLGDTAPVVDARSAADDWIDTEPSPTPEDPLGESPHPAFAETMPAEFANLPER